MVPAEVEKNVNSMFPIVNLNAKTVRERYSLSNMISEDVLEHLNKVSVEVLNSDVDQLPFVNSYLKRRVKEIQMSKGSIENLDVVKMCIFLDGLIRLINIKKFTLEKMELSKFSERVEMEIREKFAQQSNNKA